MNDKAELVSYHGWGFDRHCWNGWKEVIPFGTEFKCFDRGYFGGPNEIDFTVDGSAKIVFVHSMGLHLCPTSLLSRTDLLVVFGGFMSFHPQAVQFRRRSRLVLQQMIQQVQENPETVLREFRKNAYHPRQAPDFEPDHLNSVLLLNDLRSLNESVFDTESLKKVGKICILHGSRDGIVPKAKGRELYTQFQDKTNYLEVKNAGHALPFTHVDQCWAFIKPNFRQVIDEV